MELGELLERVAPGVLEPDPAGALEHRPGDVRLPHVDAGRLDRCRLTTVLAQILGKAAATGEGDIKVNAADLGVEAEVADLQGALSPSAAVNKACSWTMASPRLTGAARHNVSGQTVGLLPRGNQLSPTRSAKGPTDLPAIPDHPGYPSRSRKAEVLDRN